MTAEGGGKVFGELLEIETGSLLCCAGDDEVVGMSKRIADEGGGVGERKRGSVVDGGEGCIEVAGRGHG